MALPAHFLVLHDGERPIACGCVVIDGERAGIFNMVTADDLRGRGTRAPSCELLLAQ